MPVLLDAFTEHPTGIALDASDPHEFDHTPVGTPQGVVVVIGSGGASDADIVNGVTYGGVAMTRARSDATSAGDEDGRTYVYFLGSSVPIGTQTVSIDKTGAVGDWAVCYTFTADTDMVVHDHDGSTATNPAVTVQDPDFRSGMAISVIYSGGPTIPDTGLLADGSPAIVFDENIDFGGQTMAVGHTHPTHGAAQCIWSAATDDVANSVVLVGESTVGQRAFPDSTIQGARTLTGPTRHQALSDLSTDTSIAGNNATDDILTLSNVQDPGGNEGYRVWVHGSGTTGTGTGTIELWQGNPLAAGTLIMSTSGMPATAEPGDKVFDLDTTAADSITDFSDLYILYSKTTGTSFKAIYDVWFEVPAIPVEPTPVLPIYDMLIT